MDKEEGVQMDFPLPSINADLGLESSEIKSLASALSLEPEDIKSTTMISEDLIVHINSDAAYNKIQPNFQQLAAFEARYFHFVVLYLKAITHLILIYRGIVVTIDPSNSSYDFISRFFGPRVGVNEDPVTGSAHCELAAYWTKLLNKNKLFAKQTSKRGGEVSMQVLSDKQRVILTGKAVIALRGSVTTNPLCSSTK
jgi:PhzF family phenazine biosynthesis protein